MIIVEPLAMTELLGRLEEDTIVELLEKSRYLEIENLTYDEYLDTDYPDLYQQILIENIHYYFQMKGSN